MSFRYTSHPRQHSSTCACSPLLLILSLTQASDTSIKWHSCSLARLLFSLQVCFLVTGFWMIGLRAGILASLLYLVACLPACLLACLGVACRMQLLHQRSVCCTPIFAVCSLLENMMSPTECQSVVSIQLNHAHSSSVKRFEYFLLGTLSCHKVPRRDTRLLCAS